MKSASISELAQNVIDSDEVFSAFKEPVDFPLLDSVDYIRVRTNVMRGRDTVDVDLDIALIGHSYNDFDGRDWHTVESHRLGEMIKITGENTMSTVVFAVMMIAYKSGKAVTDIQTRLLPAVKHARELFNVWEARVYRDSVKELLDRKTDLIQKAEAKHAQESEVVEKKHNMFMSDDYWVYDG